MSTSSRNLAAYFDSAAIADKAERASASCAVLLTGSAVMLVTGRYPEAVVSAAMGGVCFLANRLFRNWQAECLNPGYQPTQQSVERAIKTPNALGPSGVY